MLSSLLTINEHSRFEKLDITPKSAQKIKPVLERWMQEAEERYKNGIQNLTDFIGSEPSKKRKRRTSFTPQALEVLNNFFERNRFALFLSFSLSLCIWTCWNWVVLKLQKMKLLQRNSYRIWSIVPLDDDFFLFTGAEMTELSDKLNYDREVIRVWFCNKRQALKNTIKKLKQETP